MRRSIRPFFAALICATFALVQLDRADGVGASVGSGAKTPDSVFTDRGLTKLGFWLMLPNESAVHDGVWALQQADEGLLAETATRRNIKFELQSGRRTLDGLEDQYVQAVDQYNQAVANGKGINQKDTKAYNESIELQNQLYDSARELDIQIDKEKRALDDLAARQGEVEDSRARYISLVMDIGTRAESVAAAYAALARDAELAGAIAEYNQTVQPTMRLGPTDKFTDDLKYVRTCVKNVVAGPVPVQRDEFGGLHVQATLNGKLADSMVWDTGADTVVLSAQTGRALGIVPTDKDETIEAIVADGRKVRAKRIFLDSIQLGGFTLHDVECNLLPPMGGTIKPEDLLGDTFQSHFLSRLDQRTGQLELTPIDSSVATGPTVEPIEKRTPNQADANPDLARRATATASSTLDGTDPHGAIDGVVGGAPQSPKNEWAGTGSTGSITLNWADPVIISSVKLWDRVDGTDHVVSGQLVFDDGSTVAYAELPTDGSPLTIRFRPKYVRWMRVEILTVGSSTANGGFAEIAAFR